MATHPYTNLVSVSHNDLDGFGCQYLLNTRLTYQRKIFANTNYQHIFDNVKNAMGEIPKQEKAVTQIVLSDLSITKPLADKLHKFLVELMGLDSRQITIIDHHETTKDAAKHHDFFHVDTSKCATALVQEFIDTLPNKTTDDPQYARFAERVNAYDIHLLDSPVHHQGLYMSDQLIDLARLVPDTLMDLKRAWIFLLLESLNGSFEREEDIYDLDLNTTQRLLSILENYLDASVLQDRQLSVMQKIFSAIAQDVIQHRKFFTLKLDGINLAVMQNFGTVFYAIVDPIMNHFDEVDACLHINPKRNISLRSQAPVEIHKLAQKYFAGGGHPGASGGRLPEKVNLNQPLQPQLEALQR